MKTFKAAEWDTDATGDNTYQELFKKSKSKKKKKNESKFLAGKIEKDKKHKVKLKKLLKKEYPDLKSSENTNLLNAQTNAEKLTKSKKKRKKIRRNNLEQKETEQRVDSADRIEKVKFKKTKVKIINESIDVENGINKKQKKMLKKFASELNSLNDRSNELGNELLKEKKRQRKLEKKLEKARKKEMLLSKIETTKKNNTEITESTKKEKKTKRKETNLPNSRDIIEIDLDYDSSEKKKKKKVKKNQIIQETLQPEMKDDEGKKNHSSLANRKKKKFQEKLKTVLSRVEVQKDKPIVSLRQKMMEKLKAARFRFLNEQIYTTDSKEAQKIFKSDPEAFNAYHEGYRQQVKSWPLNPLDIVIKSIKKMPKTHTIADFGCGDAKLAKSVEQKVHSFDLVAVGNNVVACDMAKVPLKDSSIDVAVFCLSLMGTNLQDYLLEANRVLKIGGILKIAEVESRFDNVENFIEGVQRFGFKKIWKDLSHNLFYFLDFKKENHIKNKKKLPTISLLPCLYKKR